MKKNIVFLCILLIFSCSDKSQNNLENENHILLKVGKKAEKTQFFKEYFELETVIPIETTDESVMGDGIRRVIAYKDKLIILDRAHAILVVNYHTGKVETFIKRKGQGPGESRSIMDIAFDDQTETILVFNDYENLLFFDLKGNFIRQEKFKKLYENIVCNAGNVLLYCQGEGYSCYPYMIDKYNLQEKKLETIGRRDRLIFPYRLYGRHIVKSKNIWFGSPLEFDLNKYDNSKIENVYLLAPETPRLTKEQMEIATDFPKFSATRADAMYGIGAIRETEHYLFFISSGNGFFMLNKETNEIHWEDYVNETSLGLRLINYFSHDGDDNRIMFYVTPNEWLHHRKNTNTDELPAALKEKINAFEIDEDSNPLLIFYREK
jgi:hypothetical protein